MYRIKVKNKDSGQELVVWEKYDKSQKDFLYFEDFDLTKKLDKSKYEEVEENSHGIPFNMFGIECGKDGFHLSSQLLNILTIII